MKGNTVDGLNRWAEARSFRQARQGVVECYVHTSGRIGAMVELSCETDIVARSDDFRALVRDIAMQVAATDPRYLRAEDIPLDATEEKTESCLLLQPFIKNPHQSVQDLLSALSAKTGEAVRVRRFARFGVDDDRSE